MINHKLAKQRGISQENIEKIESPQHHLNTLLRCPEEMAETPREAVATLEDIECELQKLWGWEPDISKHRWWLEIKGCECPKVDNYEWMGSEVRILSGECPYHGDVKDTWDFLGGVR